MYFYTLHNQEHAIVLIQNIVKLIHAIDFFKISGVDYYILFLACYLHDISMVKIPAFDSFLLDTNEADQLAKELWDNFNEEFMHIDSSEKKISEMETKKDETKGDEEDYKSQEIEPDILSVKKYMLSSYKKLDGYFESSVRERHAYINRNYSSFRTQIHEDKDKAINEEYSGNYLVGPRKTLLVDPQKDIDVKYIAIGGVEREDKSIEESHEIVKCKPADNLEIASWNSFVRKLDEYHGHHPVQ